MEKDHGPDTIQLEEEANGWAATHVDDVFDPAVRVTLGWRDLERAVERGAVVPAQAHALWAGWAAQGGPQRVVLPMSASAAAAQAVSADPMAQPQGAAPAGSSLGVLLGLALAAALGGGLVSYLAFAR
jgi:CBS-domain-containing membrane protein